VNKEITMQVAKPKSSNRPERRPEPTWLYSVNEVAEQCGSSEKTIRRLIERGELRHCKVGRSIRVTHEDLAAYLSRAA
jgi:excisionase family DNA binding protein